MGKVLRDNTFVAGVPLTQGMRPEDLPSHVIGVIGEHMWVDEGERPAIDEMTGEALSGLRDNVFVDGVQYAKGTTPPASVASKIGTHMWVEGAEEPSAPTPPTPAPAVTPVDVVEDDEPEPDGLDEPAGDASTLAPPPLAGPKGSAKAWREYAAAVGVPVAEDAKRDDVIEAIEAKQKADESA